MALAVMAVAILGTMVTVSASDTQPTSAPAEPTGQIRGKVLHEARGMGGIRVGAFDVKQMKRERKNPGDNFNGVRKIFGPDRPKPVAQVVTAADGTFSLDVPPGKYVVMAGGRKIGFAHERIEVASGQVQKVELDLILRPGGKKSHDAKSSSATTQP
jgi:hypothetical protein